MPEQLDQYCSQADFVFNFAGVNRSVNKEDFKRGNTDFSVLLLNTLKRHGNKCPVMLSSSVQATLAGRYGTSEYGLTKKAGEEAFFQYGKEEGVKVLVYRFPNVIGKFIRPNYNSAVGTFCHNIANGLPITVNDPSVELEMVYIDDLIAEMFDALEGREHHCEFNGVEAVGNPDGRYCYVPVSYKETLGTIVQLLNSFNTMIGTTIVPRLPEHSFEKKLFSMFLSYFPSERTIFNYDAKTDDRGSFTELFKTAEFGQISVNITRPGVTKGQHWHNSKAEIFVVVSGQGLIQMRKVGIDPSSGKQYPVVEFEVSGDHPQGVYMLPGYTHNLINLSNDEDLITVMWANERFDPNHPDTFYDPVVPSK
jgi:UDP-2-acetamido-2,6-beta-L-arabino-hexul-4-ose reductase